MFKVNFIGLCLFIFVIACNGEASYSQDSYANALQNTQSDYDTVSGNSGYDYAPPKNNYYPSAPAASYGPPAPSYGPPAPVYGPPAPSYYPATQAHGHEWLFDKIKAKISLYAIGKILLKLLIFKKIIKFIGIICLLMFLPKLKNLFKGDESMDDMDSKQVETDKDVLEQKIEEAFNYVTKALSNYDDGNDEDDEVEEDNNDDDDGDGDDDKDNENDIDGQ